MTKINYKTVFNKLPGFVPYNYSTDWPIVLIQNVFDRGKVYIVQESCILSWADTGLVQIKNHFYVCSDKILSGLTDFNGSGCVW